MAGIVHWGAGAIATRYLGEDTPKNRRLVYRWASETPVDQRPIEIKKSGRTIYNQESDNTDTTANT